MCCVGVGNGALLIRRGGGGFMRIDDARRTYKSKRKRNISSRLNVYLTSKTVITFKEEETQNVVDFIFFTFAYLIFT
jgi:hypothetical protein